MDVKTIASLQGMKARCVDRMEALNKLAKEGNREFTAVEQSEWDGLKLQAEEFGKLINGEMGAAPSQQQMNRPGGANVVAQVESLARTIQDRTGCTKEMATVQALNAQPELYVDYLNQNLAQVGDRPLTTRR